MGRNLFNLDVMGKNHPHLREKNWKSRRRQPRLRLNSGDMQAAACRGRLNATLSSLLSGNLDEMRTRGFVGYQGGISSNAA